MGRRREQRLRVVLPVKVFGANSRGEPFSQTACVTDLSRGGARLEGIQGTPKPGETVVLEHASKRAKFHVAWVGAHGTRFAGCAGLRALEPEKPIFGVPLPPPGPDPYQVPGAPVDRRVEDRRQSERRRHPRYKCNATVELRKQGTDVPTWAKVSDIALGGCYIEMMSPFPMDTRVDLIVNIGEERVRTPGLVRSHHPGFGMGIAFVETKPDQLAVLRGIIATLAGASGAPRPKVVPLPPAAASPPARSPAATLDAIIQWFGTHDVLTRDELLRITGKETKKEEPLPEVVTGSDRF